MVVCRHRVAVVDDDEFVRKALQRLLRASEFDTDTYPSGREFLDSLQHAVVPDCLVLDVQMPGMNGLALQYELARAGTRLPIVVITGHDAPGMETRCLAAGARAYLRKPLEAKTLLAAIHDAISLAH